MADDKFLKTVVGALSRLINPTLVRDAFNAAATESGLENIEAYLPIVPAKKSTSRRARKEKTDRKPRKMMPYTLFVTLAMDRISHDPSYASLTQGPNGSKIPPMTIAASFWKALSDEQKEAYSNAYQVCVLLHTAFPCLAFSCKNDHTRNTSFLHSHCVTSSRQRAMPRATRRRAS